MRAMTVLRVTSSGITALGVILRRRNDISRSTVNLLCALALLAGFALSALTTLSIDHTRLALSARALGPTAVEGFAAWQNMMQVAHASTENSRLTLVNRFFNHRIQFLDDFRVWNHEDYWATPLETLHKGAGDCEDYAIAKYFSLLALGIPPPRMRLTYVRAAMNRQGEIRLIPHMVLAYYPQHAKEPLVLDNLMDEIKPASSRPDLLPVFSFNSEGLWEQIGNKAASVSVDRLSRWRDLLQRVSAEGFR